MKNKTRWDALSMRDRASLIRLYTQGGVLNLKQMKKHYNSFETGGDTDGEDSLLWYNPEFDSTPTEEMRRKAEIAVTAAREAGKKADVVEKRKKTKQDKYNDELAQAIIVSVDNTRNEYLGTPNDQPLINEDWKMGLIAMGLRGAGLAGPTISEMAETAPLWGKAGLRMLRDIAGSIENVDMGYDVKKMKALYESIGSKNIPEKSTLETSVSENHKEGDFDLDNLPSFIILDNIIDNISSESFIQPIKSFAEGGPLYKVWQERTGTPWSEVDKWVPDLAHTKESNLALLRDVQAGQYDYIKNETATNVDLNTIFEGHNNSGYTSNDSTYVLPTELPKYSTSVKNKETEAIQRFLLSKNYDIGPTGVDGYMGPNTTRALQQYLKDSGSDLGNTGIQRNGVDSIIGDRTKTAYNKRFSSGVTVSETDTTKPISKEVQESNIKQERARIKTQGGKGKVVYSEAPKKVEPVKVQFTNTGQLYKDKYQHFITSTGFDLSNIDTSQTKENPMDLDRVKDNNGNKDTKGQSAFIFSSVKDVPTKSSKGVVECASHITNYNLYDGGYNVDRNGIRGDAWTMGDNIVANGGHRLYDAFSDASAPRKTGNDVSIKQATIDFVRSITKDPKYKEFLSSNLQPGDIVELLYPASPNFDKAYKETKGARQNTHIGYIVSVGGKLYVQDNIGNHKTNTGNLHLRPLDAVLNDKDKDRVLITGAVRVKDAIGSEGNTQYEKDRLGRDMSEFGITPNYDNPANQSRVSNDSEYRAMGALYKNRHKLIEYYDLTTEEFNSVAGLTQAIIFKETAAGERLNNAKFMSMEAASHPEYIDEANKNDLIPKYYLGHKYATKPAYIASDLTNGMVSYLNAHFEPSVGLGNTKFAGPHSSVSDTIKTTLGTQEDLSLIKEALRDNHPETSGVVTFSVIANLMSQVKQAMKEYDVPIKYAKDPKVVEQLTALCFNQPLDILIKTFKNAKRDGNIEERMSKLLEASYGKSAMLVKGYNNTSMFSEEDKQQIRHAKEEYRRKTSSVVLPINKTEDFYMPFNINPMSYNEAYGNTTPLVFNDANAGITSDSSETLENYANGGKIHIKPENRGKFTALKKRTGKTASWFKAHGTPAQKKMATFALNAAKWHKK